MNDESQNIEYKRSWSDEYLKWVCGFANAQGGKIFIGIDDDKTIYGLTDSHRQMEDIPNKIVAFLGIVVDVNLHKKDGKEYLELIVSPSNVPISYKGIFYYRSGATKQELKGAALQQFILKKMGRSWDEIVCEGAKLEHIDDEAVAYFVRKGIKAGRLPDSAADDSTETILRNLDLMDDDGGLRNAAILLFGKRPSKFFTCIEFKIGRFHNDVDLRNQDIISGNIIQMADKVMEILDSKYLIRPIHYEGLQRIEPLEIPEDALREIIFNAIIHKEYPGYSTQMRVYNDMIWLWNSGGLPDGITFEQFMGAHSSCPRNRLIARAFYLAGFIESWGRGIGKIKDEFVANGLEAPVYKEEMGGMSVYITRRKGLFGENGPVNDHVNGPVNDGVKVTGNKNIATDDDHINDHVNDHVNDTSNGPVNDPVNGPVNGPVNFKGSIVQVLKTIIDNPYVTYEEIQVAINRSRTTVKRAIKILRAGKYIVREGSDKSGHWYVTEKGKEML